MTIEQVHVTIKKPKRQKDLFKIFYVPYMDIEGAYIESIELFFGIEKK